MIAAERGSGPEAVVHVPGSTGAALAVLRGNVPVVVFAPHGGRRVRSRRAGDSVNDLHTAELAAELAERLDAFALINSRLDRNDVDLNRISHLVERAPEALAALGDLIEAAIAGHGHALLLSVHGWNVSAPCCDIGVGLVERAGRLEGKHPTVSPGLLTRFVHPLTDCLTAAGMTATLGHRYSASGRDNALQLFSGRHRDHDERTVATLSRLGAEGRAAAVQLELGIPLRWPGIRRRMLVDALVETVGGYLSRALPARGASRPVAVAMPLRPASRPGGPPLIASGSSVQAALEDGSGIFFGAERTDADSVTARLCIARPDGSMLLFVGEGRSGEGQDEYDVAGFRMRVATGADQRAGHEVTLSYSGPLVRYPSHGAFVDLEVGLASAEVCEATVELRFEGHAGAHGRLSGTMVAGGRSLDVAGRAVCERGSRWASRSRLRSKAHVMTDEAASVSIVCGEETPAAAHLRFDETSGPTRIVWDGECGQSLLRGTVTVDVPVVRELPGGRRAAIRFGVARLDDSGPEPVFALFERFEVIEAGGGEN